MPKDESVYLKHILDSVGKIESYVSDLTRKEFLENSLVQDAVIRQLEIIGEAAKRVPNTTRDKEPDIPLVAISGMRDKLIHDYFGVDLSTVWLTVKDDLKPFERAVERLLAY